MNQIILLKLLILLILTISTVSSIISLTNNNSPQGPSGSPSPSPTPTSHSPSHSPPPSHIQINHKVKFGLAPASNVNTFKSGPSRPIPLTAIIDELNIFWDWQSSYNKTNLYDISITDAVANKKKNNIIAKYMPMQWTVNNSNKTSDVVKYLNDLNSGKYKHKLDPLNQPKYVLSWNEPDMIGTILPASATGQADTGASSAGFWNGTAPEYFVYGNASQGDLTKIKDYDNGSFDALAVRLNAEHISYTSIFPDIQVATPVMANSSILSKNRICISNKPITPSTSGTEINPQTSPLVIGGIIAQASGGIWGKNNTRITCAQQCSTKQWSILETDPMCNGYPLVKNGPFNMHNKVTGEKSDCSNQCGTKQNPHQSCRCNGWLSLLKQADKTNYWNTPDIINIHGYHYYAHLIKLRILETILVFNKDIRPNGKKEIWLTETACIYNSSTPDITNGKSGREGVNENVKYINELFWETTLSSKQPAHVQSCIKDSIGEMTQISAHLSVPDKLPGLRTDVVFEFMGRSGTWYDHGFGAITFFSACIPAWNESCFPTMTKLNYCDSRIFNEDESLNGIWDALIAPNTKYFKY